jgi:hypothetical protein
VHDDSNLEDETLPRELADLRTEHDERGDEQRIEQERRRGGGRRQRLT